MSLRLILLLSVCLLAACGGGDTPPPPSPPPVNAPPNITSANSASVPENSSGDVLTATASDPNGDSVTLSLAGPDAALFTISAAGVIRFVSPPDFEAPADSNRDNIYQIQLIASDGRLQSTANLLITVTNVPEVTTITQVGGVYNGATALAPVLGSRLMFVAQEDGRIFVVDPASRDQGTLYLTVGDLELRSGSIMGLRGISPAPDFATSGALYVSALNAAGDLELRRYGRMNPAAGDPASADVMLRIPRTDADRAGGSAQPAGGWIGFGPDGLLYFATGTPSAARSNSLDNLLGKVLRIDVRRDDFPADSNRDYGIPVDNPFAGSAMGREVFASGFGNPRSASFSGPNLLVGDSSVEEPPQFSEVNLIRPQDTGANYGQGGITPVISIPPLRISLTSSVVGGFVYRGPSPQLLGNYIFFAGTTDGGIRSIPAMTLVQGATIDSRNSTLIRDDQEGIVSAFGEDVDGNLYFASNGRLFVFRVS